MTHSRFILLAAIGLAAQPFLAITQVDSAAAVLKNVSEYAGRRCNTPPRGSGIIIGYYSGTTDNPIISFGGDEAPVTAVRCFTSMQECQGWLYTMRSKYNDGPSVLIRCERR
ncbi:MAG: metallophosphoesterase [Phyllobacterium sp.]|uniref:metallophosphoesterase n=1 Tax=Phyllobacterium sp. TaxID=1871046 RepID=UPI0030F329D2